MLNSGSNRNLWHFNLLMPIPCFAVQQCVWKQSLYSLHWREKKVLHSERNVIICFGNVIIWKVLIYSWKSRRTFICPRAVPMLGKDQRRTYTLTSGWAWGSVEVEVNAKAELQTVWLSVEVVSQHANRAPQLTQGGFFWFQEFKKVSG